MRIQVLSVLCKPVWNKVGTPAKLQATVKVGLVQLSFTRLQRLPHCASGKASASKAADQGFIPAVGVDLCRSRYISDLELTLQWLPFQAPGMIGSALGLTGPASVYCV